MGTTISNKLNLRWTFFLLLAAFAVITSFALMQTTKVEAQVGSDRFAPVEYYELAVPEATTNPLAIRVGDLSGAAVAIDGVNANAYEITSRDAAFVKVHFSEMSLANGDTVTVSNRAGTEVYTYPGSEFTYDDQPGFWAMSIEGDAAIVRLNSVNGGSRVVTDRFGAGYSPAAVEAAIVQAESTCAGLERRDAVCYDDSNPMEFDEASAVARLLITKSDGQYLCTAWRVGPENHMLTNNHCIETQSHASNTEVWFGYQRPTSDCLNIDATTSPNPTGAGTKVASSTLLSTDSFHDYTLFTLSASGFTSSQPYGYMRLDPRIPANSEQIFIPQHGAGKPLHFGIESDQDTNNLCRVVTGITMFGRSDKVFYRCDTAGGSSGSPVLSTSTNAVVGLHNWGTGISNGASCSSNSVANSGGRISDIYPLVSSFFSTTSPAVPATPSASASGSVLSWNDTGDEYELTVTNSGMTTAFRNFYQDSEVCSGGNCSYDFSSLSDGDYTFYVRSAAASVLAVEDTSSAWSGGTAFTVGMSSNLPGLISVTGPSGTVADTLTPVYTWTADDNAEWYNIWVGYDSYAKTIFFDWVSAVDAGCDSDTTCEYAPMKPLDNNQDYEIWVSAWGQAGFGPWGNSGFGFSANVPAPGIINRISPAASSITDDLTPTFVWDAESAADWYWIWIGTDDYTSTYFFDWVSEDDLGCAMASTCSFTLPDANAFPGAGDYNWYVNSWGWGGMGTWQATDQIFTAN